MVIKEVNGNLFSCKKDYVFVHCISLDCEMGKCIAKAFDYKFPLLKPTLKRVIEYNDIKHPFSILYYDESGLNDRRVINMITKEKYWNKPTYDDFMQSLEDVRNICINNNIHKLAMPKIGCGLDRLEWNKVRNIIIDIFKDIDIEIVVYFL